jgi:hypothetical protein
VHTPSSKHPRRRSFSPVNHGPPWAAAIGHPLPTLTPSQAFPTSTHAP